MIIICILVLGIISGGRASPEIYTNTADVHCYVPKLEISGSGRQWIRQFMCDKTL